MSWHQAAHFTNLLSDEEGLENCYECTTTNTSNCSSNLCEPQENCDCVTCEINPDLDNIYECEGYRLPTSAEWEYAARAGDKQPFSIGNSFFDYTVEDIEMFILENGFDVSDYFHVWPVTEYIHTEYVEQSYFFDTTIL